ncbi:MAG: hypothetical protein ACLFOC_09600 [Campylobacterales bacterium]
MKLTKLCIILLAILPPSNLVALDIKTSFDTSYYEKYNTETKQLSESSYAKNIDFFIDSGRLSADGVYYTLSGVLEVNLSQEALKEYDLQTVVIEIDNNHYKAKPSFKKLFFTASGKKGSFGYSSSREIILVYVPYLDRIKVLGSISQGQYIEESSYKTYSIDAKREAKKEVLIKTLKLLGCQNPRECDVKSNRDGDNYFYKNDKLIGVTQNFGDEKILTRQTPQGRKKLATIKIYRNKIIMEDRRGDILLSSKGSKKIKIALKELNYNIGLEVSN